MVFRERLWVPWWAWPVAGSWPVALGVAYGHATSNKVGWLVGAATGVLVAVALFKTAAEVAVDNQQLTAGRAMLEARYLGPATPLDRETSALLRGTAADGRAFNLVRGWVPTGVRVEVNDARDPTPYWYISSRRPEQLADAVNRARASSADVQRFPSSSPVERADPVEPNEPVKPVEPGEPNARPS